MPRAIRILASDSATFSKQSDFQVSSILRSSSSTKQASGILKDLLDDIAHKEIPGPYLLRLGCNEFTERLGEGSHFRVFGASANFKHCVESHAHAETHPQIQRVNQFAVKQPRTRSLQRGESPTSWDSQESLKKVIEAAIREVKALGHSHFKDSDTLVKLLGWGLSLDDLESNGEEDSNPPIVPLLIIERADMTMSEFIARNQFSEGATAAAKQRLYKTYTRLCLDVGKALEHIHSINQTHRDLKLDNILVFNTGEGFRAKLCDFGLSGPENVGLQNEVYLGTPFWQPPDSRKKRKKNALKMCDIYVYGLVVWSAFTGRKESPLKPVIDAHHGPPTALEEEAELVRYMRAKRELAASDLIPPNEFDRILRVVCHSIHPSEFLQGYRPWVMLDGKELPSRPLSDMPTPLMTFYQDYALKLSNIPGRTRSVGSMLSSPKMVVPFTYAKQKIYQTAAEASDLAVKMLNAQQPHSSASSLRSAPDQSLSKLEIYLQELETLRQNLGVEMALADIDRLHCVVHGTVLCPNSPSHGYANLVKALSNCQQTGAKDRLYAIARLRSRLCPDCWQYELKQLGLEEQNHLAILIVKTPTLEISTATWLCRGAIAEFEILSDAQLAADLTYQALMQSSAVGGSRKYTSLLLDPKFHMLVEMGLRLDQRVGSLSPKQTLFSLILEHEMSTRQSENMEPTDRAALQYFAFAQALQRASRRADCSAQYRYFLTGRDLGHEIVVHDQSPIEACTTALHEAALVGHQEVVRGLLSLGVNVNATDPSGSTPLIAVQTRRAMDKQGSGRLDGVMQDLSKHKDSLLQEYGSPSFKDKKGNSLPLGWYEAPAAVSPLRPLYVDKFTRSVTLKRPSFGLFQKKALTLPFRNLELGHPDTLRVDISRFSSTSANESRADFGRDLISDEWFQTDIEQVQYDHDRFYSGGLYDGIDMSHETTPLLPQSSGPALGNKPSYQLEFQLLRHFSSGFPTVFGLLLNVSPVLWPFGLLALLVALIVPLIPLPAGAFSVVANLWALTLFIAWLDRVCLSLWPNWRSSRLLPSCCYEATIAFTGVPTSLQQLVIHGGIVSQFQLLLGISIVAGGLQRSEQRLDLTAISHPCSMVFLGAVFQLLPLFLKMSTAPPYHSTDVLTLGIAIVSVILGLAYCFFATTSHAAFYKTVPPGWEDELDEDKQHELSKVVDIDLDPTKRTVLVLIALAVLASMVQASRNIILAEMPSEIHIFLIPVAVRAYPAFRIVAEMFKYDSGAGVFSILHGTLALIFFVGPVQRLVSAGQDLVSLSPSISYAVAGLLLQTTVGGGSTTYIDGLVLLVMYTLSVLALKFTSGTV